MILQGFAIGNGLTDPAIQYKAYTDYALETGIIQESDYKRINKFVPPCELAIKLCGKSSSGKRPYIVKLSSSLSFFFLFCFLYSPIDVLNYTANALEVVLLAYEQGGSFFSRTSLLLLLLLG